MKLVKESVTKDMAKKGKKALIFTLEKICGEFFLAP